MKDFRTAREKTKGYWVEEYSTIPCILPRDGLLAIFLRADVEPVLDANYPKGARDGERVWYFNETRDREIAEADGDRVVCNPQVLWSHFIRREK